MRTDPAGGYHSWVRRPEILVTQSPGRTTVLVDRLQWVRFDAAGRWNAALMGGRTYRRALSGRVLSILTEGSEGNRFHEVDEVRREAIPKVEQTVRDWATAALGVPPQPVGVVTDAEASASRALQRAANLDLERDAAAFRAAYKGDPIVPPDRSQDVLLQSTVGCAHNGCTFCSFYDETRFSVHTPKRFAQHLAAVRECLGDALPWRRGIFLGDANPLSAKAHTLIDHLRQVREAWGDVLTLPSEHLPQHPWHAPSNAVRVFCDAFLTPRLTDDELREMARLGLHRVYLGAETGCDALLEFLRKPASSAAALQLVERLHAAGIHVSVLLMVGVGGNLYASRHFEDTVALVKRMRLDPSDAVVFSEFFERAGSAYGEKARQGGIEALSRTEAREQMRAMMRALDLPAKDGPRVQMYDARQILY